MTDIHCHILPEVDDGSDSMQTSVMMAAMAADDGISQIVATPHISWGEINSVERLSAIHSAAESLRQVLKNRNIPVNIVLGAEVLLRNISNENALAENIPTIENTSYSLVEFPFDESVEKMDYYLNAVTSFGISPIIAHPERYWAVQHHKGVLARWRESGYALQINSGSLAGIFGRRVRNIAFLALKERLASVVATDAHDLIYRTPQMADICNEVGTRLKCRDYIEQLVSVNPQRLVDGLPLL